MATFRQACSLWFLPWLFVDGGLAVDVLIVGAGQAGMSAAHELSKLGLSFKVLEANDHVGGRTRNVDVRTGQTDVVSDDVVEIGGTWLSPAHSEALRLAKELGVDPYNASFIDANDLGVDIPGEEEDWPWYFWGSDYPKEQTQLLRKSVLFTSAGRHTFRSPAELREHMARIGAQQELQLAEELLKEAQSQLGDQCWTSNGTNVPWRHLDGKTTWNALGEKLSSVDSRQALRNCIHAKNAQEPEAVSFLYNLLSFRGCNSNGPDSQFRLRGGTQALPLKLAERLTSRQVLLRHEVTKVSAVEDGVELSIRGRARPLRARAAILTGPPPAILKMDFQPPLDSANAQWLQRMPMGTSLKLAAVYQQGPWWRADGLQGDILATQLPLNFSLPWPDQDVPLFVQCMDHSPFSQEIGVIVCFLEGRQNLHFMKLPTVEQEGLFVEFLVQSLGSKAKSLRPTFVSHNWADQPFARGAYTGFFVPGVMSIPAYWAAFQQMQKLPNVFLAGSDYHIGFGNGYIEGAIRDGQRAAQKVALRLQGTVVV